MVEKANEAKKILIVEDSSTQSFLLKEILEKKQFTVSLAKDGVEGFQKIQEEVPDLVISDIEMPRMDGYELCKQVKSEAKYKNIPIVLLTNLIDPLDVIKGMDCGADSFLTKPCEINLLLSTIQNAFKNINLTNKRPKEKLTFIFNNQTHNLEIDPVQITELLLSTYSSAIQKNKELGEAYQKLNRIYQELEANNKKLKELNEQKNQLLGMAAHDLKNPLVVISGFSNFLLNLANDSSNEAKSHQMIERINDSSTFMIGVIDDLLDFSTIESGILTLHLSEIDLQELIQKDLLFFESLAERKNIKLKFNYEKSTPRISCDPNKMSQLLNNLITNGIKFSNPNSALEVSLHSAETGVIIKVKDSGVGMSPEALASLFQPFSKMKTKGTSGEKGSGLGLAIVNKIVTAHNGKIEVESQVGIGTTFSVFIPYIHSLENTLKSRLEGTPEAAKQS